MMRLALLSGLLLLTAPVSAAERPQIALTFDDLPVHGPLAPGTTRVGITQDILAALKSARAPRVYGFVNGAPLDKEPGLGAVFDLWREAGYPLGNHTWSHTHLDRTPVAEYVAGIDRDTALLEHYVPAGGKRWFRFPFLAEGSESSTRLAVRQALAARGMHIAGVTMSFGDFLWNDAYARCAADPAAIATLEQTYLAAATEAAQASRDAAKARYGRDIPYILLMHVGAFDARMLPRLLAQYRRQGFGFATLEAATRDPVYASDLDPRLAPSAPTAPAGATNYAALLSGLCRETPRSPT